MLPPPGAPDVLTLANTAYQLYDTYRGAKDRFKALCDDIHGLEIVLKRLANRLIIQEIDSKDGPATKEYEAELGQIFQQARNLLDELHKKVPPASPDRWARFRWSQRHVDSIRSRITSLCSIITAFNTSIIAPQTHSSTVASSSQEQILRTLDDILIKVRALGRPESTHSTLVEQDDIGAGPDSQEKDLWEDLAREMQDHGMSKAQISAHRNTMLQWARTVSNQQSTHLNTDGSKIESWEVISAVYGPAIMTLKMQQTFDAHLRNNLSKFLFRVTNETFGGDPHPGNVKAFSMVWRKVTRYGRTAMFSPPQTVFAKEGDEVVIDLGAELACAEYDNSQSGSGLQIISASWHNRNVTERISTLVKSGIYNIAVTTQELLTDDPCYGYVKVLSVTWTYSQAPLSPSQFQVQTALDFKQLVIPPYLNILCANWGGFDITGFLQPMIRGNQTLGLDMNNIVRTISHDPWPNRHKVISIIYQYGSDPLEIITAGDGTGMLWIKPTITVHRSRNWRLGYDIGHNTAIMAVVWGLQPLLDTPTLKAAVEKGQIRCSNRFFGFDGWNGVRKTCQIFLLDKGTGGMSCVVGYEDSAIEIQNLLHEARGSNVE